MHVIGKKTGHAIDGFTGHSDGAAINQNHRNMMGLNHLTVIFRQIANYNDEAINLTLPRKAAQTGITGAAVLRIANQHVVIMGGQLKPQVIYKKIEIIGMIDTAAIVWKNHGNGCASFGG